MTPQELIALAEKVGETEVETETEALEVIYGHGVADDVVGHEGFEPRSVVRVEEWLLWTDTQGFTDAERCETVEEAERRVARFARTTETSEVGAKISEGIIADFIESSRVHAENLRRGR